MVVHTCIPLFRTVMSEDHDFEAAMAYIVKDLVKETTQDKTTAKNTPQPSKVAQ